MLITEVNGGMEMFGSKGRKERKRLMALLLAGAMLLSGFISIGKFF